VSRNALVAKQLPYVISGGIGGIALVGVGAVFLGTEELRRDSGRLDRLERMVLELHAVLLDRTDAPEVPYGPIAAPAAAEIEVGAGRSRAQGSRAQASRVSGTRAPASGRRHLVALPVGQSYHRPDCTMVEGKPAVEVVTDRQVADRGLKPCRLCEPDQSDLLPW
jgi:hypothetical protein